MKRKWYFLIVSVILGSILVLNASSFLIPDKSFRETKTLTRIRNIGHLVLAQSGDNVSRVLPIQSLPGEAYKIVFEKAFMPNPDSIFAISSRQLAAADRSFAIELYEQSTDSLLYSFVVSKEKEETILPCLSRPLPETNYAIIIRFDKTASSNNRTYIILGASLLVLSLAWSLRKSPAKIPAGSSYISIGKFQFYPSEKRILSGTTETVLTGKETQVLTILSRNLGTVVERQQVQKEIWEDQGVIVTRSLDIFVSRIRKKLIADEAVRIVNVHGKGYKLEVVT